MCYGVESWYYGMSFGDKKFRFFMCNHLNSLARLYSISTSLNSSPWVSITKYFYPPEPGHVLGLLYNTDFTYSKTKATHKPPLALLTVRMQCSQYLGCDRMRLLPNSCNSNVAQYCAAHPS